MVLLFLLGGLESPVRIAQLTAEAVLNVNADELLLAGYGEMNQPLVRLVHLAH